MTESNQHLVIMVERDWYLKKVPAYDAADFQLPELMD